MTDYLNCINKQIYSDYLTCCSAVQDVSLQFLCLHSASADALESWTVSVQWVRARSRSMNLYNELKRTQKQTITSVLVTSAGSGLLGTNMQSVTSLSEVTGRINVSVITKSETADCDIMSSEPLEKWNVSQWRWRRSQTVWTKIERSSYLMTPLTGHVVDLVPSSASLSHLSSAARLPHH